MKTRRTAVAVILLAMLMLTGCPKDKFQTAAIGVQKYGNALDAFQDGEIKAHTAGFVSDVDHHTFQSDFKKAALAGKDLDNGIVVALAGSSPKSYIDAAYATSDGLLADLQLVKDPTKQAELQLLFKASRDLLDAGLSGLK